MQINQRKLLLSSKGIDALYEVDTACGSFAAVIKRSDGTEELYPNCKVDMLLDKLAAERGKSLARLRLLRGRKLKKKNLHVDFYEITEEKPIVMEVPIKLNGLAEGVKAGGKLAASVRKLKVYAPYTAIPEKLNIDVTHLGLGKTIKVSELSFEGLEIITSPNVVVCQVKMTRNAMSAASKEEE